MIIAIELIISCLLGWFVMGPIIDWFSKKIVQKFYVDRLDKERYNDVEFANKTLAKRDKYENIVFFIILFILWILVMIFL